MQSVSVLAVLAAAAAVASSAGCAQAAPAQTSDVAPRAIAWRSDAAAGPLSPAQLLRECQRVVAVVGPVTRYVSHGQELAPGPLARCNRYAGEASIAVR